MKFKYQFLIDSKGIKLPCPAKNCKEVEIEAYRWGHSPLDNALNFLPNFLYNEKLNGVPMRFNSEEDMRNCGYCSLSLFDNAKAATETWFSNKKHMIRIREMLKYTHLLKGTIKKELGVATDGKPHFEFFEYENVELREVFVVLSELKVV